MSKDSIAELLFCLRHGDSLMLHHSRGLGFSVPFLFLGVAWFWFAADATLAQTRSEKSKFRTDRRVLWTESRIEGTPDPPDPYRLAVAFPRLTFEAPIDLVAVPGGDRLAIVEHRKGISTFQVDQAIDKTELMLKTDGIGILFSAAFHPRFVENGLAFFVYGDGAAMHVARVRCSFDSGIPTADPDSRRIVFTWPNTGHYGGCLRFGPDGYLYVGTGDGSDASDANEYAQDISDPRGSMLRLDVDHPEGDRLYRVPPDNPFRDEPGAFAEIFAYGLRQPWKFSFDSQGRLWAGDVGQDLWEMIYLIQKGGNYGWSITEGSHAFRPERRQGPTPILPPVVEHHHTEFRSITGGHFYQSDRLEELRGAYVYGDFDTGRIWMLRYDDQQVGEHRQLASSQVRVVGFGQDHAGEVYVVGYASGKVFRLERSEVASDDPAPFPRKLSETGLFSSTADHDLAPGIVPYSINAPAFADGAQVHRFLGLPDEQRIEFDALLYPRGPGAPPGWRFPDGTVIGQTFAMPHAAGAASSNAPRKIETRILHHRRMPGPDDEYGAQVWHAYSYVWNDDQTDAELAEAGGGELRLSLIDPRSGDAHEQTWRVPSRSECAACHNIASKHAIAVNTMQLNRAHDYGGLVENQLSVFQRLGLFAETLPDEPSNLARLADYHDPAANLNDRARSYLHANCAHCHRQWGGGNANFQLMSTLSDSEMGILDASPTHGAFGIQGARTILPGDPYRSVALYRMLSLGSARMPRLGTTTIDAHGAELIHDWIANMKPASTADAPEVAELGRLPAELLDASDVHSHRALVHHWLSDASRALRLIRGIDSGEVDDPIRQRILEQVQASEDPTARDLFDRYLPEQRRLRRLGDKVDPDAILALPADAGRGESLFFNSTALQCKNCHKIGDRGIHLGPDLSLIGKQLDSRRLLDSIVNPSREVKPEYQVFMVQTTSGQAFSGMRVPDQGNLVVLKDAENKEIRIASDQIERIAPQGKSLMPDAQTRSLTAQQLADLVAYLITLQ